MKKFAYVSVSVFLAAIMLCLVIFPDKYIPVAANGLKLWAVKVLPSLFPFFFLTLLLTKLGTVAAFARFSGGFTEKAFRCNGISFYVFLMSVLSGYPVGAKLIGELYSAGKIDRCEATRMSAFCSTSGPLFVAGTVGAGMFGNKICGFLMLAGHVTSAVICGIIFRKYGKFERRRTMLLPENNADNILYECVYSSVISILCVGGFICVFYLLSQIFADFGILYPLTALFKLLFSSVEYAETASEGFVYGLIECTNGCGILSSHPGTLTASLACALVSFGAVSVMFQSLIYLVKAKVNIKIFLLSKTAQMLISFAICFVLLEFADIF